MQYNLMKFMKIAFLTDPLSQFKIYKDTTFAMMREAVRRGHQIFAFGPEDLALQGGEVIANIRKITLTADPDDWFRADAPESLRLAEFDAVLQRKDPPFRYGIYLRHLSA